MITKAAHGVSKTTYFTLAGWRRLADWLGRAGFILIMVDVLLSTMLGLVTIVAWPAMRVLGSGPGGGAGIPMIALLVAAVLGVPSLFVALLDAALGHWRNIGRMLAFVGPAVIMLSFFFVSHVLDPCARNWLDLTSRVFGIPVCEPYQTTLNIHTRLHLLHHALIPTAVLAGLYWAGLRMWHPAAILTLRSIRRVPVQQALLSDR